jgi:hypothetical protein
MLTCHHILDVVEARPQWHRATEGNSMEKTRETVTREITSTHGGVLLTPSRVRAMLAARTAYQVVKFRTTCTDCVPNM